MEGISELLSALDRSSLDEQIKSYLKDVVIAHADGKGAAAMDSILTEHTKESQP